MLIIGIDPGKSGGIAVIPLFAFKETQIYQLNKMELADIAQLFREIREGSEDGQYRKDTEVEVFLENPKLPAMNKGQRRFNLKAHQGLSRSVGQLEGLCIANDWIPNLVSPMKWQNWLGCRTGGDKNISLNLAQSIFYFLYRRLTDGTPVTRINHSVADALLIALYGYLHYAPKNRLPTPIKRGINPFLLERFHPKQVPDTCQVPDYDALFDDLNLIERKKDGKPSKHLRRNVR